MYKDMFLDKKNNEVIGLELTAMGCRQCLPLSVVQLKGKHCRKTPLPEWGCKYVWEMLDNP